MSSSASPAEPLLSRLGARVRLLRHEQGISRRKLSSAARISERYIAQLESGRGNISVRLLDRIARAMGVDAAQLLYEERTPPLERFLAIQGERLHRREIVEGEEHGLG